MSVQLIFVGHAALAMADVEVVPVRAGSDRTPKMILIRSANSPQEVQERSISAVDS
jgi:hypothetical protein